MATTSNRIAIVGTVLVSAFILIVPNVADWSASHIYHPDWTAHSRFHTVWQLIMQSMLAGLAIFLAIRGRVGEAATINLLVLIGFYVALGLMGLGAFEGGLNDMKDGTNAVAGLDGNLVSFTGLFIIQSLIVVQLLRAR